MRNIQIHAIETTVQYTDILELGLRGGKTPV